MRNKVNSGQSEKVQPQQRGLLMPGTGECVCFIFYLKGRNFEDGAIGLRNGCSPRTDKCALPSQQRAIWKGPSCSFPEFTQTGS